MICSRLLSKAIHVTDNTLNYKKRILNISHIQDTNYTPKSYNFNEVNSKYLLFANRLCECSLE